MSELNSPMVALKKERLKYYKKKPSERFSKGDRVRCFAGTHAGRVGTVKNVGTARLTMSWDDDDTGRRTYCDASYAELLSVWHEAQATAPPSTLDDNNNNNTNTGTRIDPERTNEGVHEIIEKRLNNITVDLVAMLRMCNNPAEAWKDIKQRVDTLLLWHEDK